MALVAVIMILCVILGAFIMFKGKQTGSESGFFGGVPKGQVFSIPEAKDTSDFPADEADPLGRTAQFLSALTGGSNADTMPKL